MYNVVQIYWILCYPIFITPILIVINDNILNKPNKELKFWNSLFALKKTYTTVRSKLFITWTIWGLRFGLVQGVKL